MGTCNFIQYFSLRQFNNLFLLVAFHLNFCLLLLNIRVSFIIALKIFLLKNFTLVNTKINCILLILFFFLYFNSLDIIYFISLYSKSVTTIIFILYHIFLYRITIMFNFWTSIYWILKKTLIIDLSNLFSLLSSDIWTVFGILSILLLFQLRKRKLEVFLISVIDCFYWWWIKSIVTDFSWNNFCKYINCHFDFFHNNLRNSLYFKLVKVLLRFGIKDLLLLVSL